MNTRERATSLLKIIVTGSSLFAFVSLILGILSSSYESLGTGLTLIVIRLCIPAIILAFLSGIVLLLVEAGGKNKTKTDSSNLPRAMGKTVVILVGLLLVLYAIWAAMWQL